MHWLEMLAEYSLGHNLNILVHVIFGTAAILLGVCQVFSQKGGKAHRRIGKLFVVVMSVALMTAAFGTFVFGFRSFLAALTLSASYGLISAVRVLAIRRSGPKIIDNVLSCAAIFAGACIIARILAEPLDEAMISYVVLGNVLLFSSYDLLRNIGGAAWLERSWLNEHIVKMLGSLGALLSAAGGNVMISLQPWSIFLPVGVSSLLILVFILRYPLTLESLERVSTRSRTSRYPEGQDD
jgi:uncharacterized membrane protein